MINLTLINDDFENRKLILNELDYSDKTLCIILANKQGDEEESLENWINKDMAKAMISFLKQQFELG